MRWSEQPASSPRRGKLAALWEEWVTENPFHWHESGLRPEHSRWRSKWMWILGAMIALRVVWLGAGLAVIFGGEALVVELKEWWRQMERGSFSAPGWLWGGFVFAMATGLMNLLLILLPPHMAAKSWQRDRTEAWREHLGVVPVTSDRVIFAKSHLWLMLIFIGKLATLVVAMLLALAAVMKSALGGGPIDLFAWMGTLREQMGIDMGAAVALWLPLAVIQGILGVVKSVLWWVLIFEFIILFGLQGMGPLVNLTIVGLIILSIGGMFGFGMMLAVGVVAILVPGPTAMMVLQVLAGMVEVALLGAGCWFFWRALKRMVAKHYHLSG